MKNKDTNVIWTDKKRHFGLPLSFTTYTLTDDCLIVDTGFLNLKRSNVKLFRIKDYTVLRSLGNRIFGCGTVHIDSVDATMPHMELMNILNPLKVQELLDDLVDVARKNANMHMSEFMGAPDAGDCNGGV